MEIITQNWVFVVGGLGLLLAGFAFGRSRGRESSDRGRLDRAPPAAPRPLAPGPDTLPPEALARIHDALRAGNKIQAIKILREATGLGLAEAKNAVEAMER